MCGIWGYIGNSCKPTNLFDAYNNIKARGPERSEFFQWKEFANIFLGFHRLSILDTSVNGDQPFHFENENHRVLMSCNGEIYNYEQLKKKYELPCQSHSDCEVIMWLYIKFGFAKMLELINGEFAIFIFDIDKKSHNMKLYLTRDQCGIRPLFYGKTKDSFAFCSEIKGLTFNLGTPDSQQIVGKIQQFPPRQYLDLSICKDGEKVIFTEKFIDYTTF